MLEEADTGHLKSRVAQYVRRTDYVSFAELANRFGAAFYAGDRVLELRENLIL